MIKVEDKIIEQETFGDGTLKCSNPILESTKAFITITWCYDSDAEIFTLWSLVKHIKDKHYNLPINLALPYIPHARQDRQVSGKLFTLKYFAELINRMEFSNVFVLDPHSDVSTALIDRVRLMYSPLLLPNDVVVMYPDAGAAKKYSKDYPNICTPIIGNKCRDESGKIISYELLNFVEGTKKVVIRDDICSYGGTFVAAAKSLKSRGVEEITLIVSHCENNILKGDVLNWIDNVITTDSICTISHPQIEVKKRYREGAVYRVQD